MLIAANNFALANKHVKDGGWDYIKFRGRELRGRNLLIIGRGKIGLLTHEAKCNIN